MNRDTKEKQDQSLRVLLVEDDPEDITIFLRYAQRSTNYRFQVDHIDKPDMMESFLSQQDYDLVFLDLRLGAAITGLELLKQIKPAWPDVPVIILTGSGDQKIAVEMMKIGATDYLTKDTFNSEILDRAVRYALEQRRSNLRRKQAEQSLKASQQRLAQIINFLPDATFVIDNEGKVIAWNRAIEKMTGIKAQEMLGKGNYEYAIPFYGERRPVLIDIVGKWDKEIEEKYQYVKKEGESLVSETYDPLVHPEGFLWNKASLLYDHNGEVIGAIESIRDISERKKSEEALRESEKKYRTVLDSNPDPVVAYDMEGKVIYLNRAFARVFGWSLDEQIGKKIDNFVPEENWPETRMMINKVTVLGEGFSGLETRRYTKEGKILDIGISGSCYRDQEGNVAASVINLRDITERKQLETRFQQAQKMEAIATLAGGIAHQFNNALTSITGHTGLLEMEFPDNEKIMDYAKQMKESAHRMARLTSQLLAYARGGKYNPQTMLLSEYVEGTLPLIRHTFGPNIRVETDLPPDILNVEADRTQMQMVLSALMDNANEAIEGPGRITITTKNVEVDQDFIKDHPGLTSGRYVCLSIEDDGKGMDEETRSRIFEPFFTTKFQGRGLAMASVYGIVTNHGGFVSVDSELGKGTTVRIYLPAISAGRRERGAKVILTPEVELPTGEGTVLVIEDEEPLVKLFREILERLGYRVLQAGTGKEAVEIARTFDGDIDLALLDIKLPDMEGGRVYPLIMEARPNLKVLVCSGYSIDGPARKILDAGAQGFIQKPFSISTLAGKLKEVSGGANNPRNLAGKPISWLSSRVARPGAI